jgi:hypothetical protein
VGAPLFSFLEHQEIFPDGFPINKFVTVWCMEDAFVVVYDDDVPVYINLDTNSCNLGKLMSSMLKNYNKTEYCFFYQGCIVPEYPIDREHLLEMIEDAEIKLLTVDGENGYDYN